MKKVNSREINQAVKIPALPKKYQPRLEAGAGGSLGYVMQAFICSLGQNRRLLRYARNDGSTELAEVNLLLSYHIKSSAIALQHPGFFPLLR